LAHSKSALKRWRQDEAHRARNRPVRTAARTAVKKAQTSVDAGRRSDAEAAIREAASVLDRAAKRRVIHHNAAARHKSRLMRHLNRVGAPQIEPAAAPKRARQTAAKPAAKPRAPAKPRAAAAKPRTRKTKE
jgi:small subunit ribosomal protein S20